MLTPINRSWFDLKDVRKRKLANTVWVPLHTCHTIRSEGRYGYVGYQEEFHGLGSVGFPLANRAAAQSLSWSDIGISHSQSVWATNDYYKPVETYQYHDREDLGTDFVLIQRFESEDPDEWHLSQDLVFALGLKREGDDWVRPAENFTVVAKIIRDAKDHPTSIVIRNEYLRDYLCARAMFLRTSEYFKRDAIVEALADAGHPEPTQSENEHESFELRVDPILEGGNPADSSFAVFTMSRTDVDPDEDVPQPGPETEENTTSRSWTGKHRGHPLFRVSGELWRTTEIEPSSKSPYVRGDKVPSGVQYIVDALGTRAHSEDLGNEDEPRWLWFRPEVILALTKHRDGKVNWYTQDTGGVRCSYGSLTHFGVNSAGLVTVYAYDVAKLPTWQQRVWAAHNVSPDGGVSAELLSSQMRADPAKTTAPEAVLPRVIEALNNTFLERIASPLLRVHPSSENLIKDVSRFKALEPNGLYVLAKDLIRLFIERVDVVPLQKICVPPKGEKWGSIKTLEKYLGTIIAAEEARKIVGVIAGVNELRIADAHLPSTKLASAYTLARVDQTASPLCQGFQLIASFTSTLMVILDVVSKSRKS